MQLIGNTSTMFRDSSRLLMKSSMAQQQRCISLRPNPASSQILVTDGIPAWLISHGRSTDVYGPLDTSEGIKSICYGGVCRHPPLQHLSSPPIIRLFVSFFLLISSSRLQQGPHSRWLDYEHFSHIFLMIAGYLFGVGWSVGFGFGCAFAAAGRLASLSPARHFFAEWV